MTSDAALDTIEPVEEQTQKRDLKSILIPAILVLLGLVVLVYPVVATQWNNVRQQAVADEYSKLEKNADPVQLNTEIDEAHRYNAEHKTGPILDPWLARVSENNLGYTYYLRQLDQFDAMARIVVPPAKINLPVYHGTDDKTLQKGVGHLYGSDLPVGGPGTHSVLTGHTGLPNATLFDNLTKVKEGDAFYIQVSGEKLKYKVDQILKVLPHETESLKPVDGQDYVTLITCTPYGINSHRLLVRGHRVPMDPADEKIMDDAGGITWQWWMWVLLAGAIAIAVALTMWIRKQLAAMKDNEDNDDESDEDEEASDNADGSEASEETEESHRDIAASDLIERLHKERGDNE